jgi:hypothetical protein
MARSGESGKWRELKERIKRKEKRRNTDRRHSSSTIHTLPPIAL